MEIRTIDRIPKTSPVASAIDDIAVFSDLSKISHIALPAKIDFILLAMCENGRVNINYDSNAIELTKSSLAVLRPGHIIHSYEVSHDWRGHVIVAAVNNFDNSFSPVLSHILPCVVQYASNPVIRLSDTELNSQIELRNILEHTAYDTGDHHYRTRVIRSLLEALFFETLGVYMARSADKEIDTGYGRRKDTLLTDFVSLISNEYRQQRSVAYYAAKLCVSPKHLSAIVKEVSGRTASQWIDSYVITEAKLMMRHSGMTIQEISSELNFPNQSFFGKYFKNLTGMSPREFRAKMN